MLKNFDEVYPVPVVLKSRRMVYIIKIYIDIHRYIYRERRRPYV